jgi:hypothetical protein
MLCRLRLCSSGNASASKARRLACIHSLPGQVVGFYDWKEDVQNPPLVAASATSSRDNWCGLAHKGPMAARKKSGVYLKESRCFFDHRAGPGPWAPWIVASMHQRRVPFSPRTKCHGASQ